MEILVPTGMVPNGVGIGQEDANLFPLSPCCGARVLFNWEEEHDWDCSVCKKEIPFAKYSVDRNQSELVTSKKAELEAWVALWLEVPVEDVSVVRSRKKR